MNSTLNVGQYLKGKTGTYQIIKEVHQHVWTAMESQLGKVIIKTAPPNRLDRERNVLKRFRNHPSIRPLLDGIREPPCLVLKHLDDNVLDGSNCKRFGKSEIKLVTREVLEALESFHDAGIVHTDIKPDNILINHGTGENRFNDVQLGDCDDVYEIQAGHAANHDRPMIGAAMFRSPEANMNLPWGTPTDIWSMGATVISLFFGDDLHIFQAGEQSQLLGPFPLTFQEIVDPETLQNCTIVQEYINDSSLMKPFNTAKDPELDEHDKRFISRVMKIDPRDGPTATELLQDEWLQPDSTSGRTAKAESELRLSRAKVKQQC